MWYMLKPCQKEELAAAIHKCVGNIERKKEHATTDFTQRSGEIEKICDEISEIKSVQGEEIHAALAEVMQLHPDISMLRDAVIPLLLQYEENIPDAKFKIRKLTKVSDAEELLDLVVEILKKVNSLQKDSADAIASKMAAYAEENYSNPNLNVQYIAENVVFLSKNYAGRHFLKKMGMKFSEYLLQTRMEKAIQIVKTENVSAESIAEKVGLGNNVQYFYRLFKQYTGMTLGEFRESLLLHKEPKL